MATEKRLIDANVFAEHLERMTRTAYPNLFPGLLEAIDYVKEFPTVDAVEVSRLGRLGKMMMPYSGCPRGPMGASGEPGNGKWKPWKPMELDAIKDVDGNRWVPVLEQDLERLKGVEVVHGRWVIEKRKTLSRNPYMDDNYHAHATCSECGFCIHSENASFGYPELNTTNYCPNCGADMDGDGNGT